MDQFHHMRADFGSHIDHLSNETCQMNTRIGCIACYQSRLGAFPPSPSLKPAKESSLDGGDNDDDDDDASSSKIEDEMTASQ